MGTGVRFACITHGGPRPRGTSRVPNQSRSSRWTDGDAPESVTPSPTDGGFTFAIGDRRFVYDRLGLRRA